MKNNTIITNISEFFVKRSRLTILLILTLLTLGFYTYTSVLKREGFPVISVPLVIVNTPYFSGVPSVTEEKITKPIYDTISQIEGIKEIQTTSTDKISTIIVSLDNEIENANDIKDKIEQKVSELNLSSKSIIVIPNAALVDGENDLLFTIYNKDLDTKQLQEKAIIIKEALEKSSLIKEVNIKEQITSQFDFRSNKPVISQTSFSKVIVKEDEKLVTYDSLNIGVVKKNAEIGAVEISDEVQKIVGEQLDNEYLNGTNAIYSGDPAISLKDQISSLESNALAAIVTIFIILLLFINWRSAIILALFIPLTLGAVFITFTALGYTLNTISLFALILVLGLFVDDGTIVVEAIDYYKKQGYKGFDAVKKAINDIGIADISGTLTTVLVFLPLVFVSGILGDFIKILPVTVILALLISLIIALTILPFLSTYIINDKKRDERKSLAMIILDFIPNAIISFTQLSAKIVKNSLNTGIKRLSIFILSLVLIGVGIFYATILGFSFFAPAKDSELLSISVVYKDLVSVTEAKKETTKLEEIITNEFSEEIEELNYFNADTRSATIRVQLTPINQRDITAREIAVRINEKTKELSNIVATANIISAGPPVAQYPFAMQVYSDNPKDLTSITDEISKYILELELSKDVDIEDVKIDYIKDIRRKGGNRYSEIKVKFGSNNDSSTLIELQNIIEEKYSSNDTYTLEFDFGQESENASSFSSVAFAGIIAILVMYAILVLQFNSFTQPLLILIAIPFSFPGLFPGLYYTDNPMSFFVVIGLTGLVGIVVNNTIMLIEYANTQRNDGKNIIESITEAVRLRTRPILTTSLTTVAGLIPLAISEPFWEPLAYTIIFGLLSSVIMIVIAFPVYYYFIESMREKVYRLFRRG